MQSPEQVLVTIELKSERLVSSSHVFHLLIDQLLHCDHVLLLLARLSMDVIRKYLQSLGERLNLSGHFIAQIARACDVFEYLLLFVLEVLVEALCVSQGILNFYVHLHHSFLMLFVLLLDLSLGLSNRSILHRLYVRITITAHRLHQFECVEFVLESILHVLHPLLNLLDLLVDGFGGSCLRLRVRLRWP